MQQGPAEALFPEGGCLTSTGAPAFGLCEAHAKPVAFVLLRGFHGDRKIWSAAFTDRLRAALLRTPIEKAAAAAEHAQQGGSSPQDQHIQQDQHQDNNEQDQQQQQQEKIFLPFPELCQVQLALGSRECYDSLKAAVEATTAESVLPSFRRYLSLHAEPPPILPLFLGGPRPPVPFLLPQPTNAPGRGPFSRLLRFSDCFAASIGAATATGDTLRAVLREGVIRVGLLETRFLPSSVRHLPIPESQQEEALQLQTRPAGVSFRVLEVAISLLSYNYERLLPAGAPLRLEYLLYSNRAALFAALLEGSIHLTEPALAYSNMQTTSGGFASLRLHAALAPSEDEIGAEAAQQWEPFWHKQKRKQQAQDEQSSLACVDSYGPLVWGSSHFFSAVSAGTPWAAAPILLSTQKALRVQRVSDLGIVLMRWGIRAPLVLLEAALPEIADIALSSLPPQTVFGLVDMTPSEGTLPDPAASPKPIASVSHHAFNATGRGEGRAQEGPLYGPGREASQEEAGNGVVDASVPMQGHKGGSFREKVEDGAQVGGGKSVFSSEAQFSIPGASVLQGGVYLLSLSQALHAIHEGVAAGLLHATPLGELLQGFKDAKVPPGSPTPTVAKALPWLLEVDADLTLPLTSFFRKPEGSQCLRRDRQEEFASLVAAAAEAAGDTRRLFLIPDDEL
ncbi:uncharacterized protein LOC34621770 [Cyclospora cayetanensis]|uniref:Uncharacterized protein LOC34621770 n=1 Tax=Cyclospora cayetanensis TaxID=88456 RepID=A0A6P6S2U4_9EIME|nr:uncharacterized protein LOC34621770 [Cyclospora cayetanensis]